MWSIYASPDTFVEWVFTKAAKRHDQYYPPPPSLFFSYSSLIATCSYLIMSKTMAGEISVGSCWLVYVDCYWNVRGQTMRPTIAALQPLTTDANVYAGWSCSFSTITKTPELHNTFSCCHRRVRRIQCFDWCDYSWLLGHVKQLDDVSGLPLRSRGPLSFACFILQSPSRRRTDSTSTATGISDNKTKQR